MQIIYTELKNTLEYVCSINVFDTQMLMRVSYNSRSKKRLISLTSLDESILFLKPTYITEGSRVFPNVNAKLNGLSFYITLNPLSFSGENYKDWANQYKLCFVEYTPYTNLTTNRFYSDIFVSDDDTSVTPSFGDWVVTQVEVVNQDIKYFGEKTNTIDTYDSYASYPLEQALINSFHDVDMQQWQAVKDAANQLIGVTNWAWDVANNQISYFTNPKYPEIDATQKYIYVCLNNGSTTNYKGYTKEEACSGMHRAIIIDQTDSKGRWEAIQTGPTACGSQGCYTPYTFIDKRYTPYQVTETTYASGTNFANNPAYDPNATLPKQYVPFSTLAQKILSNTLSTDQGIALLAEAYIEAVVNSIFNTNPSKQFVKLSDLIAQLELNKTLRS